MNPSTLLARVVVAELVAAGVSDVVLCPGSRSAPLAYALHAADAAGQVRLHVRHDERSAAFTALGVGMAGGLGAVVTTSGTAVANLHPAVAEASEAGVPLLVLSADRPHALRGTWANQTTALAAGIFGAAVRRALDLPAPVGPPEQARMPATWRAGVRDAVRCARGTDGHRPGPVHLDLAFDDPLVPDDDAAPAPVAARPADGGPTLDATALLSELGVTAQRTVVLAGANAGANAGPLAREVAELAGWPLLAEPSSGARSGPNAIAAYRLLLREAALGGAIERVVAFGRPTLSRPTSALLARDDVEVVQVVAHPDDPGPAGSVRRLHARSAIRGSRPSAASTRSAPGRTAWLAAWQRAGAAATGALTAVLDEEADGGHREGGRLSGPLVARELAAACSAGDVLVAAASNPIRDLDLAGAPWTAGSAPMVLASRGLSGIDGTLSTAAGAALSTGRRARALVGDLAFLHDANGLLLPVGEPEPELAVVVVNDDGGGIFTGLEHGEPSRQVTFDRLFGTPHNADLGLLCAAFGVSHVCVDDVASLRAALGQPVRGRSVVEVVADRSRLRALHARIAAAVSDAVARALA